MRIALKNIFVAGALYILSSCAYTMNSKTVDVTISSNPAGADIVIDGKSYGRTPATINIEPKNYNVVLTKEGYGSAQIKLEAWQTVRRKEGEAGRCIADTLGSILILPLVSVWSVYCRDFKEPEYSVNIPYLGAPSTAGDQSHNWQQNNDGQYQNYYQPYNYNNAPAY